MIKPDFHPVSEIFPLMSGAAFDELVADIKANGLREPIWTHNMQIIDGRNRYLACEKAGVEPTYREWDGEGDLKKFNFSMNYHRRHMTESQRAMVAARMATRPSGSHRQFEQKGGVSIDTPPMTRKEAAAMVNVGEATVGRASLVLRQGTPEQIASVDCGKTTVCGVAKSIRAKRAAPSVSPKPGKTRKYKGNKAPRAVRNAIGTLVGIASGLDSFAAKDAAPSAEETVQWEKELAIVIAAINRFRRQLKEVAHV